MFGFLSPLHAYRSSLVDTEMSLFRNLREDAHVARLPQDATAPLTIVAKYDDIEVRAYFSRSGEPSSMRVRCSGKFIGTLLLNSKGSYKAILPREVRRKHEIARLVAALEVATALDRSSRERKAA